MSERIPIPEISLFDITKRLRTLGGAVVHLFTRQLGDEPPLEVSDHFQHEREEWDADNGPYWDG